MIEEIKINSSVIKKQTNLGYSQGNKREISFCKRNKFSWMHVSLILDSSRKSESSNPPLPSTKKPTRVSASFKSQLFRLEKWLQV